MFYKVAWWLGLSVLSGVLYHIAGKGGFKNAKLIRRLGCALLALILWIILSGFKIGHIWAYGAFVGLNYGALSTYWDKITALWRGNGDEYWENWILTGLGYGLSAIPLLWCGVALWTIIGRAIFLALTIMWLRTRTGKVLKEEFGSGLIYSGSIPILFL